MILVTGSSGLIGGRLSAVLSGDGLPVRPYDMRRSPVQDVRDGAQLRAALKDVEGVVHLAAISRVVWAEWNPFLARQVNVGGLRTLLAAAHASPTKPWVIFASSREVYGDAPKLPVREDATLSPLNVYARSKVAGERLMADARAAGLTTAVCRFSNVYGAGEDHADRLVVAFARTSAHGGTLHLEGPRNVFDLTHVDDVGEGLATLIAALRAGERLPPIHFVSGAGTSIEALANLAEEEAPNGARIGAVVKTPRSFDVSRFVGDPRRAAKLLGWRARTPLREGFRRLVDAFRDGAEPSRPWLPLLDQARGDGDVDAEARADRSN